MRISNAQPTDRTLGDLKDDDAVRALLGRDLHGHSLITFVLVGFFQRRPRLLDILRSTSRSEERIDRPFDLGSGQVMRTQNAVLLDKKRTRLRRRRFDSRAWQADDQQQPGRKKASGYAIIALRRRKNAMFECSHAR